MTLALRRLQQGSANDKEIWAIRKRWRASLLRMSKRVLSRRLKSNPLCISSVKRAFHTLQLRLGLLNFWTGHIREQVLPALHTMVSHSQVFEQWLDISPCKIAQTQRQRCTSRRATSRRTVFRDLCNKGTNHNNEGPCSLGFAS